jgi:ATP-dependent DNA helicase RecG
MTYHDKLSTGITFLKGVGEFRARLFGNLGIYSVRQLLEFFPRDYLQRNIDARIRDIESGQFVVLKVTVYSVTEISTKKGTRQLKAVVTDGDRFLECIWFIYGKWVTKLLVPGSNIWVNGAVSEYGGNLQMSHPQVEVAKDEEESSDFWKNRKILPIYNLTASLTQNIMRNTIYNGFATYHQYIYETLPPYLIKKYDFLDRKVALQKMHFTTNPDDIVSIKKRFVYEELLYLQIMITKNARSKVDMVKQKKHKISMSKGGEISGASLDETTGVYSLVASLTKNLPFTLTSAQKRVISEIFADMTSDNPMNRLLQGDVGSGKTIVTLYATLLAIENGYQVAFVAPTEILAEQHYKNISRILSSIDANINICLIKGGKSKQKTKDKARLAMGDIHLAIGTHALIQKDVIFKKLSLVIIDEQHRFGVVQRSLLSVKHDFPDLLYLSATPIPRSLAMTIFGEMSVSSIDELPPTRKPVKTVLALQSKKHHVYSDIRAELIKGRQIYIVCPLITESENVDLQDAESLYKRIKDDIFPEVTAALLHGRMKQSEKECIMSDFTAGMIKILVSTTVIEVGIDVPNASVMMIEHAERFGLAQLHQLRGRVGRGADQSYCYLIAYAMSEMGRDRLNMMVKTNDGFLIAEKDLELRGPGDMFGTNQSGLPEFRFANIITDQDWLYKAKTDAQWILDEDPDLSSEKNKVVKEYYQQYISYKEDLSQF